MDNIPSTPQASNDGSTDSGRLSIGFDPRVPGLAGDASGLLEVVTQGERMGFDYVTLSDHLVSPVGIESVYPYAADGKWHPVAAGARHDALTAIAFLAAKTTSLRFVTSVLVLPYRPAVLTAKMLATIDVLSEGRLAVGVGTGWMEDEFKATSSPPFAERGKVTDEYLAAMKALWTQARPSFDGVYTSFKDIEFEPKPAQTPHPPIWVGGLSRPAMRRVTRFGDAWYPVLTDQKRPLDSLALMNDAIMGMREQVVAAGRSEDSVTVAVRVHEHGESVDTTAADGGHRLFSGPAIQVARDLSDLRRSGVSAVDVRFTADAVSDVLKEMDRFRHEVMPHIE